MDRSPFYEQKDKEIKTWDMRDSLDCQNNYITKRVDSILL